MLPLFLVYVRSIKMNSRSLNSPATSFFLCRTGGLVVQRGRNIEKAFLFHPSSLSVLTDYGLEISTLGIRHRTGLAQLSRGVPEGASEKTGAGKLNSSFLCDYRRWYI